jgi:hypothetical protein
VKPEIGGSSRCGLAQEAIPKIPNRNDTKPLQAPVRRALNRTAGEGAKNNGVLLNTNCPYYKIQGTTLEFATLELKNNRKVRG